MRKILRAKSPYCTSDPSLHARSHRPLPLRVYGAVEPCLSLSAVLRPVFAAFQNPPLPHHGHKRAVFALLFAAFLLLSGGNARAQGTPDLVVLGPDVRDSIETGATFWLLVTVTNQGDGRSAATTVRYYRSTDSTITTADTLEGTDAVRALVRPQGYGATIQLTAPSTAGTYYYGACVDAVAGELDTTNNCSVSVAANVVDPPGGGGGTTTSVPGAPRNLTAVVGDGQVVLSWDAPSSDGVAEITDYEYRINRSGPWIPIGSTDTTYTVTGLVNGTSYVFEVRAVNAAGRSASTNRAEATPELFILDFAHFANGDGIASGLVLVNVASHPIRPALSFYDQEGHLIAAESGVDIMGDLEIQEDGSLSIQRAMEPLGELTISTHGQGELVSGSAKVVSGGPIGGVLRFDLPDIGVAGVGASPPVRDAVFPVRRQKAGINTGVAIHNLESSAELVRCELMREGVLHDAVSIPLAANGQTSWLIEKEFPAADTSDFTGAVRCDAVGEGRFSAVALEMDPATRTFTTLPVFPVPEMPDRE